MGNDILQAMGTGPGSQGYSGPLGPGSYSYWVRQGGPDAADWDLNFVVTSSAVVPVPSAVWMGGSVLLACGVFGRMRRRSASR